MSLSEAQLKRLSANEVERRYDDALLSRKDVTRWVRLSSKLSGRIYEPHYGYHLRLRRREDLEDKLFRRKAGYWRRR